MYNGQNTNGISAWFPFHVLHHRLVWLLILQRSKLDYSNRIQNNMKYMFYLVNCSNKPMICCMLHVSKIIKHYFPISKCYMPEYDNVLQHNPRSGEGCNTLLHEARLPGFEGSINEKPRYDPFSFSFISSLLSKQLAFIFYLLLLQLVLCHVMPY